MVQVLDENCKNLLRRMLSGRVPTSPPLSKDELLKDTGHIMNIENLIFGVSKVMVLYFIHHGSLLRNATDIITKCDRMQKIQNTSALFNNPSPHPTIKLPRM